MFLPAIDFQTHPAFICYFLSLIILIACSICLDSCFTLAVINNVKLLLNMTMLTFLAVLN